MGKEREQETIAGFFWILVEYYLNKKVYLGFFYSERLERQEARVSMVKDEAEVTIQLHSRMRRFGTESFCQELSDPVSEAMSRQGVLVQNTQRSVYLLPHKVTVKLMVTFHRLH